MGKLCWRARAGGSERRSCRAEETRLVMAAARARPDAGGRAHRAPRANLRGRRSGEERRRRWRGREWSSRDGREHTSSGEPAKAGHREVDFRRTAHLSNRRAVMVRANSSKSACTGPKCAASPTWTRPRIRRGAPRERARYTVVRPTRFFYVFEEVQDGAEGRVVLVGRAERARTGHEEAWRASAPNAARWARRAARRRPRNYTRRMTPSGCHAWAARPKFERPASARARGAQALAPLRPQALRLPCLGWPSAPQHVVATARASQPEKIFEQLAGGRAGTAARSRVVGAPGASATTSCSPTDAQVGRVRRRRATFGLERISNEERRMMGRGRARPARSALGKKTGRDEPRPYNYPSVENRYYGTEA